MTIAGRPGLTTPGLHQLGVNSDPGRGDMDSLNLVLDLFLHLDEHLRTIIDDFGVWTYAVLFLIIFCETGLVVTPFLPGDSLLFAAGALAALDQQKTLHLGVLLVVLSIAAVLGDTVNYWIGRWVGPRAFSGNIKFLKQQHLVKTQLFYERYGGKTIILARFVPIVRTFAPFVAGIGVMNYAQFLYYNIVGGIAWVVICTTAGYWLGNLWPFNEHFEFVVLAIVLVSVLPIAWEYFAARRLPTPHTPPTTEA
jgi:membrane-associated protein